MRNRLRVFLFTTLLLGYGMPLLAQEGVIRDTLKASLIEDSRIRRAVGVQVVGSDQIRNQTILDLDTPPACFDLSFKGLTPNADGYYRWEEFEQRIKETLDAFSKTAKGERPF